VQKVERMQENELYCEYDISDLTDMDIVQLINKKVISIRVKDIELDKCYDEIKDKEALIAESNYANRAFIKQVAIDFFFHWYNASGTNTDTGFDEWYDNRKSK
jgi:hypothetical protein